MRYPRVLGVLLAATACTTALADWNVGDPHVMHFPQVDKNASGQLAYDVNVSLAPGLRHDWVADDWQASKTTAVTGIHIWGGWYDNHRRPGAGYTDHGTFQLSIYDTAPTGGPGALLWTQDFTAGSYKTRLAPNSAATQWLDPGWPIPSNFAGETYQINFSIAASSAFVQQQGQMYWLAVNNTVDVNGDGMIDMSDIMASQFFGWRNTGLHFGADAVHAPGTSLMLPPTAPPVTGWTTLPDPDGMPRFDMAFVVTPAPGTLAAVACFGTVLARRRREGVSGRSNGPEPTRDDRG